MFRRPFYIMIVISMVAAALIAASRPAKAGPFHLPGFVDEARTGLSAPYTAANTEFQEDFSAPVLDPAWTVIPGARYYNTSYGLPVNDYSLTANAGHLRYTLNPMSHQHGFLNGYQAAPPPQMNSVYGYDPGLEIYRPLSGDHWLLETKVTYYLPCANGRLLNLFVYFGPGGTGTTAAGWGRGRDTDCSSWGQNSLFAQIVTQPGATAGDLQYESATESLPIGDPALSTYYLRLERAGALLTWSRSTDNVNWTTLFSKDFGTALDGLAQRVTIVGHSWFVPAGSYADYDYVSVTSTADITAPTIAITTPADGATYLLGQVSLADYACEDEPGGSGLTSCIGTVPNGSAIDTTSIGTKSFTVSAADNAGNTGSASASYNVIYSFGGFFAPVDNLPTMNIAKAGQTIPLKWRITDVNGVPVTTLSSVTVTAVSLACEQGTTSDQMEEYASGSSGLQNLGDGYYQFNWKTPKSYANSCKTIKLNLGEGPVHEVLFRFTR